MKLFGLETEYGIIREDQSETDPVVESMELVRAYLSRPFRSDWDYAAEDPRQDARGFRAPHLAQDEEERAFNAADQRRSFSFHEMKSDLCLPNGARFYNDHTHPEFSTPECRGLRDLVSYDRAGERIVQECADRRNAAIGTPAVQIYKNNTDLHGHSYGCHDNYLVPRSVAFDQIVAGLAPFLVTRQIFAGAGKTGIEDGGGFRPGTFQLSQRADFIEVDCSVDTMDRRPLINSRDEPHADPRRWRRLHQIAGDANLCEIATALKVGTTGLVLRLIERGALPAALAVDDPIGTLKRVSRDASCRRPLRLADGRTISPIDHQRGFLAAAEAAFGAEDDPDTRWLLARWRMVLDDLETDPQRLAGQLDWVAKKWLIETFIDAERCGWDDPRIASLDLEYHNLAPSRGLYRALELEGRVERLTTEDEVKRALTAPPADSRAAIRGLCIERFGDRIARLQWERITLRDGGVDRTLDLADLFEPAAVAALYARVARAGTVAEIFRET